MVYPARNREVELIDVVGYVMTCDGSEACPVSVYGESRISTIANGRENGWTFSRGAGSHYCLAHTVAKKCKDCGRYMRPQGRPAAQFPPDWIAIAHNGYCTTCVAASTGNATSPATEQLERAVAQYMETFPKLRAYVEEIAIEDQEAYARRTLARYGANDLEEAVFG